MKNVTRDRRLSARLALCSTYSNVFCSMFQVVLKISGEAKPSRSELKPEFRDFQGLEESFETINLRSLLRNVVPIRPSEHTMKLEIYTRGTTRTRGLTVDAMVRCGFNRKFCKISTRVERSPIPSIDTEPFKVCTVVLCITPYV